MSRTEENKTSSVGKALAITAVVAVIILGAIGYFSFFHGYKSEKMGYVANSAQLYAGPGEGYAPEEEITGYFSYEKEEGEWLALERKNSDDEAVIRWVNTKELTSWGEYRYKETVELAIAATE